VASKKRTDHRGLGKTPPLYLNKVLKVWGRSLRRPHQGDGVSRMVGKVSLIKSSTIIWDINLIRVGAETKISGNSARGTLTETVLPPNSRYFRRRQEREKTANKGGVMDRRFTFERGPVKVLSPSFGISGAERLPVGRGKNTGESRNENYTEIPNRHLQVTYLTG